MKKVPIDIKGLRLYTVSDIQKKQIGANEWHRIRNELVFNIKGSVKWTCEDLFGNEKVFNLSPKSGLWIPPFILHTYEVKNKETVLLVIASTLFIPDDSQTHDTYSAVAFRKLQAQYI
ncbi:MAG: WxcM-like domain-containing protein [Candidatus Saccharimonadales bacterium]